MQIELKDLRKTYTTDKASITAVDGISLTIPENTIFGIIGKSGAGKSSLVRLISMLEKPDEGEVYYNGKRVDNLEKKELILARRGIGMIFQNFNLFSSRTAGKNVAYPLEICGTPKDVIKKRVHEMLDLVGLADRENAPISTLSGGQKQRVAIARALSTKPEILFCDEATSALDPQTTSSILSLIRDIQKKMNLTVVMITHQMEVVRDACSQVAVIENGHVVEQGFVSDVFTQPSSPVTRDFIAHMSSQPKEKEFLKWSDGNGNYTLHFVKDAPGKPILSLVAKNFDVSINILAAGVQHLPDGDIGQMEVTINGEETEVKKALDFLKNSDVLVEEAK